MILCQRLKKDMTFLMIVAKITIIIIIAIVVTISVIHGVSHGVSLGVILVVEKNIIIVVKKDIIIVVKKKTSVYAELEFNSAFLILGVKIFCIFYVSSRLF